MLIVYKKDHNQVVNMHLFYLQGQFIQINPNNYHFPRHPYWGLAMQRAIF